MPDRARPPRYGAYLLRCWQVRSEHHERPTWRFSLEAAGAVERRAFPDLETLVAYLREELARDDPRPLRLKRADVR